MRCECIFYFLVVWLNVRLSAACCNNRHRSTDVVWNVPTGDCRTADGVPMLRPERYGIRTNAEQATDGSAIVIFYDLGLFPAISTLNSTWIYGGVPQNGNLTEHLEKVLIDIDKHIPDEDFEGVAVIDFESWRPVWSMASGTQTVYREASIDLARGAHPDWNDSCIVQEAARQFEQAGRRYMLDTLHLCKRLRPRGKWGYYGYPMVDNYSEGRDNISANYMKANDELIDVYTNSSALFPSIYVFRSNLTSIERGVQVRQRILETFRLRDDVNPCPVYPYFWFSYHEAPDQFLTHEDLTDVFGVLRESGVEGLVIWGSSEQATGDQQCQRLRDYLDAELGPIVRNT